MNKDLFTGSLGKLDNHGGSRIYTTPNTIYVPPEYEIDIGEHGDFVACSLNGRLWLFKDKLIVLKWNSETKKLEFATSLDVDIQYYSIVTAVGKNFIYASTVFFLSLDEEPFYKRIAINENISEISSEAYIDLENETLITAVSDSDKMFSLFSLVDGFYSEVGGSEYLSRFIYHENKYWTSAPCDGLGNVVVVGYVSDILPYTFTHDGTPKTYQIYIKPMYYFPVVQEEGTDVASVSFYELAKINGRLVCCERFIEFDISSSTASMRAELEIAYYHMHKNLCLKYHTNIYDLQQKTTQNYSGNVFVDPYTLKAFALDDDIMKLIDGTEFTCKGIVQWVAPKAEKTVSGTVYGRNISYQKTIQNIESISDDNIIFSFDDNVLVTHLTAGFFRELLTKRKLSLTGCTYQTGDNSYIRLSMGVDGENIIVNDIASPKIDDVVTIPFDDFYRDTLKLEFINNLYNENLYGNILFPVSENQLLNCKYQYSNVEGTAIFYRATAARLRKPAGYILVYNKDDTDELPHETGYGPECTTYDDSKNLISQGLFPKTNFVRYQIFYLDWDTFEFHEITREYEFPDINSDDFTHSDLIIKNNELGIETTNTYEGNTTTLFNSFLTIPSTWDDFQITEEGLQLIDDDENYYYGEFAEPNTRIQFYVELPEGVTVINNELFKFQRKGETNIFYHVFNGVNNYYKWGSFSLYKCEFYNDFDFEAEAERSKEIEVAV